MIVEDNENLREAVCGYLELDGFETHQFERVRDAERELDSIVPDLLLLDVMLPDSDGFRFAKRIRERSRVPIIFLTARAEESDRITGFEVGADDYVVKPFSPKELVLRVKALLKRSGQGNDIDNDVTTYRFDTSELQMRVSEHRMILNGKSVILTAAEWTILEFLIRNAPTVFSRNKILENCLESIAEGSERTIDTHIKNIRRKIGPVAWIETVRSIGYRFNGMIV